MRFLLHALFAGLVLSGLPASAQSIAARQIEWPAVHLLDGRRLSPADLDRRPVLVVFWATDCPFCARHNAHVEKLVRKQDPRQLTVLSVALDRDPALVRDYMTRHRYTFPVALDGQAMRADFTSRKVIPMTCLVHAGGVLDRCIPGEMFEEDVFELAAALASGKNTPPGLSTAGEGSAR